MCDTILLLGPHIAPEQTQAIQQISVCIILTGAQKNMLLIINTQSRAATKNGFAFRIYIGIWQMYAHQVCSTAAL